jgi:hypothetical protein
MSRLNSEEPTGAFQIVAKKENSNWSVPPAIQKECNGKANPFRLAFRPAPDNPLGWLGSVSSIKKFLCELRCKDVKKKNSH